jgi:uncharacterized protein YuzE
MGKNKIGIRFDEGTDLLYVSLRKGASVDSGEIEGGVRIEYDAQGQIVGVRDIRDDKEIGKATCKTISKNREMNSERLRALLLALINFSKPHLMTNYGNSLSTLRAFSIFYVIPRDRKSITLDEELFAIWTIGIFERMTREIAHINII